MNTFINRIQYIDKLLYYKDKDLIKVVTGLRRSGKSTLLELYRTELIELAIENNQIQSYNFELPENFVNKSWDDIYFEIKERLINDQSNYVF
ncbi:MAG: AAA family ATPase [Saprospiraceae bacterium]|nr:AAA family ATPase [Saprospiraceae bacterium]